MSQPSSHRRLRAAVGVIASLTVFVAACGGDDDASSPSTEVTATTDAASAATSAPASTAAGTDATATTVAETAPGTSTPADCDVAYEDGDPNAEVSFIFSIPPRQFDPHRSPSIVADYVPLSVLYDRLLEVRAGPVICPMVADSWEFSATGTELTLHLDPAAVFWDGTPIDADAVKANLDRARSWEESTLKSFLSMVTDVVVVDPQTVTIVANRPAGDLPSVLSSLVGSLVNPAAFADPDTLSTEAAGSGPYEVTELVLDDHATYTRRDGYWNPATAGKAKTLVLTGIVGDSNKLNTFRAGTGDFVQFSVGAWGDFSDYADSEGDLTITTYPYGSTYQILLNTDQPGLDNQLVRQALNHAIDRDEINEAILYGQCPPTSQMLQAVYPGHLPELDERYPYDPERAKELLAEAGYADGFSFEIGVGAGLSPQVEFAQIVQAQLAEIGVDVTVTEGDSVDVNPRFGQGELAALSSTRLADPDPGVVLRNNYTQGSRFPGTLPDGLAAAIEATLDPTVTGDARTALLEEANRQVTEQALDLFICAISSPFIHSTDVVNADLMGVAYYSGTFDMRYITKRAG